MTYPFLRAKYYTVGGIVQVRAFLWHMAEGYGTASWLTHPSNNNSAHFVIEKTGRIVQMVKLTDAAHSAHVAYDADDRDASDCGGLYSDVMARRVLGTGWLDVNAYVIAIEVEGYRAQGPNYAQKIAIRELYRFLRGYFPKVRGNLGHRDVQDYKSCPGCLFPWASIDGHGLFAVAPPLPTAPDTSTEDSMRSFGVYLKPTTTTVKSGTWLYDSDSLASSAGNVQVNPGRGFPSIGGVSALVKILNYNGKAMFVRAADIVSVVENPDPIPANCTLEVARAVAAEKVKATAAQAAAVKAAVMPLEAEINRLDDSIKTAVEALT
jgi:hypothetical protein